MAAVAAFDPQRIEVLGAADLAAAHRLQAQCMGSHWSEATWQQVLAERYLSLCCKSGDEAAGFIIFSKVVDEAELQLVCVDAKFRLHRLASRLLSEGLGQLVKAGVKECFLEVDEANTAAMALYQKFGFDIYDHRKAYYKNSSGAGDAALMRKSLG